MSLTSGTYGFAPEVAEMVAEAWERLGIEPETLRARHAVSSRRSLNFMFAGWATQGFKQPWITVQTFTLALNQINVLLAAPAIDVFHAYLTRTGYDTEMYPIGRSDYEAIPNKTQTGRPTMYFVDYSAENNNGAPTVKIWQASQNSTDVLNVSCFNRYQDSGQANQGLFIPYVWYEACASGLAAALAVKWKPEKLGVLAPLAASAFKTAQESTREKGSTRVRVRMGR
jgi:hypothetical protein